MSSVAGLLAFLSRLHLLLTVRSWAGYLFSQCYHKHKVLPSSVWARRNNDMVMHLEQFLSYKCFIGAAVIPDLVIKGGFIGWMDQC